MGMSVDLEPHTEDPLLTDDLGSIWLSMGLVAMSDPNSGEDSCNCLGGVAAAPVNNLLVQGSDSEDDKLQGLSLESEFSTDVSEYKKRCMGMGKIGLLPGGGS